MYLSNSQATYLRTYLPANQPAKRRTIQPNVPTFFNYQPTYLPTNHQPPKTNITVFVLFLVVMVPL